MKRTDSSKADFCKRAGWVCVFAVVLLGVAGCADWWWRPLRPEAELLAIKLPASVDISTIASLATFAVLDRVCRAQMPQRHPLKKGEKYTLVLPLESSNISTPVRTAYGPCIEDDNITFCDASADDLRTLKTLMEHDPRLRPIADFNSVVAYIDQKCGAANRSERLKKITSWPTRKLHQCTNTQPGLIAYIAYMTIRWPLHEYDERLRECSMTYGNFFISLQCRALEDQNEEENRRRRGQFTVLDEVLKAMHSPPTIQRYGFEAYFCLDLFNSKDQ